MANQQSPTAMDAGYKLAYMSQGKWSIFRCYCCWELDGHYSQFVVYRGDMSIAVVCEGCAASYPSSYDYWEEYSCGSSIVVTMVDFQYAKWNSDNDLYYGDFPQLTKI